MVNYCTTGFVLDLSISNRCLSSECLLITIRIFILFVTQPKLTYLMMIVSITNRQLSALFIRRALIDFDHLFSVCLFDIGVGQCDCCGQHCRDVNDAI